MVPGTTQTSESPSTSSSAATTNGTGAASASADADVDSTAGDDAPSGDEATTSADDAAADADASTADAAVDAAVDATIDAGADGAPSGEAGCSVVTNAAPEAQIVMSASAAPTPMGGTIVAGTYYGLREELFAPCLADTSSPLGYRATFVVEPSSATAGTIDLATAGISTSATAASIAYTLDGTSIALQTICPAGANTGLNAGSFTATDTEVDLFQPSLERTIGVDGGDCLASVVAVFAKQ
jgi:hypothetical protein